MLLFSMSLLSCLDSLGQFHSYNGAGARILLFILLQFFVDPDGSIADSIMREKESSRRQQPVFGDENGPPPAERCGADFAHQGFGGEGDENDENQENIGMPINLNA